MNAVTNPSEADARFVRTLLARHHGNTREARSEVRQLHDAGPYGKPWYAYIGAVLAYRQACEVKGWRP